MVNGSRQPIALLAELPPGPLQITGADLTGTVLDPRELERLAGLEHVRELVPARIGHLARLGQQTQPNVELKAIRRGGRGRSCCPGCG